SLSFVAMSAPAELDLDRHYQDYLRRLEKTAGEVEVGAFVKHNGRLVKKLRRGEFEPLYTEYFQVAKTYFDAIDRGDTINDMVVRIIRERATELFLDSPV